MTSPYHGSKLSASQQSFLIFALSNDGRKVWSTVLFRHAQESHTRHFFPVFYAIFAGPRFVEVQKFCYHGNAT